MKAVIFDLDGVIVSTDEYHFKAWKRIADEEGIHFNREINENLRGVSRMESLEIILKGSVRPYKQEEKVRLAQRKNNYYRELLENLTPEDLLPGVIPVLRELKKRGIGIAIGSSSKNSPLILEKIELCGYFDAVADGNDITHSKPDPEVFLLAAKKLGVNPSECVVVEDADAGIEAALAGGMKAVGVGYASNSQGIHYGVKNLSFIEVEELLRDIDKEAIE